MKSYTYEELNEVQDCQGRIVEALNDLKALAQAHDDQDALRLVLTSIEALTIGGGDDGDDLFGPSTLDTWQRHIEDSIEPTVEQLQAAAEKTLGNVPMDESTPGSVEPDYSDCDPNCSVCGPHINHNR